MSDAAGAQGAPASEQVEATSTLADEGAVTTSGIEVAPATTEVVKPEAQISSTENGETDKTDAAVETDAKPADEATNEAKAEDVSSAEVKPEAEANSDQVTDTADAAEAPAPEVDEKKSRRKSVGVPEHKGKKLNKKQSKAKLTHTDAKPGDHYYIRLKGYPLWPGVVTDFDMLPQALIDTQPVSSQRKDGTWREDYAEGGKNVKERFFPVMYLFTNEFSWIRNTDLVDLDFETVGETNPKMRGDLKEAHLLAAQKNDLDYYKQILQDFQDQLRAAEEEKEAKKAATAEKKKAAGKAKRKSTLSEPAVDDVDGDEDVEMADADVTGEIDPEEPKPKSKKRKADAADGASTPARTDSVKKPKIKINNTPKATNGGTPKASAKKEAKPKAAKPKKNGATNGVAPTTPVEPQLTEEEKRVKKEREIMSLRHRLQKGMLGKDQAPKEEEMKQMSEYIAKLEAWGELEVAIIRATKINKVLKGILKIDEIPKEGEFNFKSRSQALLDKWNKILDGNPTPAASSVVAAEEKKESDDGEEKSAEAEPKTTAEEEKPVVEDAEEEPAAAADDTPVKDDAAKEEAIAESAEEAKEEPTESTA